MKKESSATDQSTGVDADSVGLGDNVGALDIYSVDEAMKRRVLRKTDRIILPMVIPTP